MLRMFNHLNEFYVKEKRLLIDTIIKYQSGMRVQKKLKIQTETIRPETKRKKIHPSLLNNKKKCERDKTKQVKQDVTPTNKI